jgi:hypothetical protein
MGNLQSGPEDTKRYAGHCTKQLSWQGCWCHRSLPLQGVHSSAWQAWHKNRFRRMWHDDCSVSVNRSLAKLVTVHPCRLPYQSRPETDALARRAQERAAAELYAYQQQAPVQAADLEQRPVYEWVCVQSYSQYAVILLASASSITAHYNWLETPCVFTEVRLFEAGVAARCEDHPRHSPHRSCAPQVLSSH